MSTSWMHFGPGQFFFGHTAPLAQSLGVDVAPVSLRSGSVRAELAAQGGGYHVVAMSERGADIQRIDSVHPPLVAPEDPRAVVRQLADAATDLVSLTITQPAYHYDPSTGLDVDHPEIATCLRSYERNGTPSSAIGFIVRGLSERRRKGIEPFAVLSLDGFVGNGDIARRVVLTYADRTNEPGLRQWIADNVTFANTMVDRIVPKTTPLMTSWLEEHHPDVTDIDKRPIFTEPWPRPALVIGDHRHHPALVRFARAGALLVDDVMPYSLTKVQMLNGAHFVLGMTGGLAGHTYAHEAVRDPAVRRIVEGFLAETQQLVTPVAGVNLDDYAKDIVTRLENPFLRDELVRLARNGRDKVGQRVVGPLQTCLADGLPRGSMTMALAAWAHYLQDAAHGSRRDIADAAAKERGLLDLPPSTYRDARQFLAVIAPELDASTLGPELQMAMDALPDTLRPLTLTAPDIDLHKSGSSGRAHDPARQDGATATGVLPALTI